MQWLRARRWNTETLNGSFDLPATRRLRNSVLHIKKENRCQKQPRTQKNQQEVASMDHNTSPEILGISVQVCKVFTNSLLSSWCSDLKHPSCWIVTIRNRRDSTNSLCKEKANETNFSSINNKMK